MKLHQPDAQKPSQPQLHRHSQSPATSLQLWDYLSSSDGSVGSRVVHGNTQSHMSSPVGVLTHGIAGQAIMQYSQQYPVAPSITVPYQLSGGVQNQMVPYNNRVPMLSSQSNHISHLSSADTQRSVVARLPGRNLRENAVRTPRMNDDRNHNRSSTHNVVEPGRIKAGVDVRTTIMLRNIPNKMQQAELKDVVDDSSFGKYDFMYLRIDFQNECNVGYAFINFVDPLDIVDFWNARAGTSWDTHGSNKIAEISYATIQGKDCLVSKFRNSSVMLEAPEYRPKVCLFVSQHEDFD